MWVQITLGNAWGGMRDLNEELTRFEVKYAVWQSKNFI